jgi:hypothetical protein
VVIVPSPRKPVCTRHGAFLASCTDCHDVRAADIAAATARLRAAAR